MAGLGNAAAQATLDGGPDCPDELFYIYEWARNLVGMSGVGMGGALPVTPTTIRDWADITGEIVRPWEVPLLRRIDAVLRHPTEESDG